MCGSAIFESKQTYCLESLYHIHIVNIFFYYRWWPAGFKRERDSVRLLLSTAKEDTNKVFMLMKAGWWWETYSLDSAAVCYLQMKKLSSRLGFTEGMLRYYANYTYILNHQGKYDESLKLNLESIALAKKSGTKVQLANCLFNTGSSYNNMSRFEEAIDYYIQASTIFEELKLPKNMAFAYGNIGALFYNIDQPEKGYQYSLKGLAMAREAEDLDQQATFLINCGVGATKTNRLPDAERYFKEGLEIAKKIKSTTIPVQGYIYLGELYITLNRLTESVRYAQFALEESKKINSKYNVMQAFKVLSEAYAKMQNSKLSAKYAQDAIDYAKTNDINNELFKIYLLLGKAQGVLGDYRSAYENILISRNMEDSINQKDVTKKIEQLEISYQSEVKEKQILQLQGDQKSKELLILGLSSGITIILIVSLLIYNILHTRRRVAEQRHAFVEKQILQLQQEQQLVAAESILRGHEEERRRVARDLHDGLGGLLSGVKISLSNMKNNMIMTADNMLVFERSIDMLNNSIQELRRVAQNMMPESLVKFGLVTALEDFCTQINNMKAMDLKFQIVGNERRLDGSQEIILYRIVQELVNNALKHSAAQNVLVQILYEGETLSLTVEDDGKGFDKQLLEKTNGSGWPNIRSRVEYLKGTLDLKSAKGEGTSVYVIVRV